MTHPRDLGDDALMDRLGEALTARRAADDFTAGQLRQFGDAGLTNGAEQAEDPDRFTAATQRQERATSTARMAMQEFFAAKGVTDDLLIQAYLAHTDYSSLPPHVLALEAADQAATIFAQNLHGELTQRQSEDTEDNNET